MCFVCLRSPSILGFVGAFGSNSNLVNFSTLKLSQNYLNVFPSIDHPCDLYQNIKMGCCFALSWELFIMDWSCMWRWTKNKNNFKNEVNYFEIVPKILDVETINIFGKKIDFLQSSSDLGVLSFSPRHITNLPNIGETDVFRSLQLLPGIQMGISRGNSESISRCSSRGNPKGFPKGIP